MITECGASLDLQFSFPSHAAAGACYLCGTSPSGPVLVTDRFIEYEGSVCICVGCCKFIGTTVGLVEGKKMHTELKNLRAKVAELEPQAKAYTEIRKALDNAHVGL